MSTEDYEKLDDSVLSYKKRNKLGRFGESDKMDTTDDDLAKIRGLGFEENKRCEIDLGDGSMCKRGTIRFIGNLFDLLI
jgi:tubulin-folding cofactor B